MAEGGKGASILKSLGCGCMGIVVVILMLSSFILGAKYGKDFVEGVSDGLSKIINVVGETAGETRAEAKKAADVVRDEVENYN